MPRLKEVLRFVVSLRGELDRWMVHGLSIVFIAVSIAVTLGGIALGVSSTWFVLTAAKTHGRVIGAHQRNSPEIGESERRKDTQTELLEPVFVFTNSVGESITVTQRSTSILHKFPVGSAVTVYYEPKNAKRAEIGDLTLIYFGPVLLVVMGIIGLSFTIFWRYLFLRAIKEGRFKSSGEVAESRMS